MSLTFRWGELLKQILCEKIGEFKMLEVEKPTLEKGHAIIKIKRIGICGTDIHAYNGVQPFFTYPRVLGHELSGVIDEIDSDEESLKAGDKVAIIPYRYCGKCNTCKQGKTNCCPNISVMGVHEDGGMQEYISVPTSHLLQVNDLSLDEAALLEPLAIGAHAVRRGEVNCNQTIAVVGAGPIGLGIMLFAKEVGANIIAVDINENRLKFCHEWLDIKHSVNAIQNPVEAIQQITNGNMVDIVFDATGNKKSMEQSLDFISYGGKVVYVGLTKETIQFHNPDFHKRETTLMGSRNATIEDFLNVYHMLKNSKVNIQRYITHRAPFQYMLEAFPTWIKPDANVIKAMVEL